MTDLQHDRMPGGTAVPMFRETASGPMPDTDVWAAIKKGSVRHAKTLPGIGSARFIAYQINGEHRYAVIRVLDSNFRPRSTSASSSRPFPTTRPRRRRWGWP